MHNYEKFIYTSKNYLWLDYKWTNTMKSVLGFKINQLLNIKILVIVVVS